MTDYVQNPSVFSQNYVKYYFQTVFSVIQKSNTTIILLIKLLIALYTMYYAVKKQSKNEIPYLTFQRNL